MRVVAALGGNALLERGERPDASIQLHHIRAAACALAPIARDHELIIIHGNGPQVGVLAMESEADKGLSRPYPLDVLGAQTQGMIGYWLAQELGNCAVGKPAVSVVTQTVVDSRDRAFTEPEKFVGEVYDFDTAHRHAAERGWSIRRDSTGWRRVVASPMPQELIELPMIKVLVDSGAVVICGGGGGAPVVRSGTGALRGVEAVVDKDRTAALAGIALRADHLLVLTDVAAVMKDFGTDRQSPLDAIEADSLAWRDLPAGSMGPKVSACSQFAIATRRPATIGALADAVRLLAGTAGTRVTAGDPFTAPARGGEMSEQRRR